jgi:rubrerythrin
MMSEKFNEIIDFAIGREREAVAFYNDLQNSVHFIEKKKLLVDLENMEKGHVTILERLRQQDVASMTVPEVQNLHISDYIVADSAGSGETLSYQDILIIAMKREEASHRLYNDLAQKGGDSSTEKLFLKLASEEAKHKLLFEKMYDDEILTQD